MHGSSEKSLIRPSRSQGFHDLPELARSNTNLRWNSPDYLVSGSTNLMSGRASARNQPARCERAFVLGELR
jgi:hypothetical protein